MNPTQQSLLHVAALIVIVAGIKLASEIVVPFLLATFIAVVAGGPIGWLKDRKVPVPLAILLVLSAFVIAFVGLGALIGKSVTQFLAQLDFYQQRAAQLGGSSLAVLARFGIKLDDAALAEYLNPGEIMRLVGVTLRGFGGVLSNGFLILLTVVFMLLEAPSIPGKLRATLRDPTQSLPHFERFTTTVSRYMALKTTLSLGMGAIVALLMFLLGIDFPLLWGLLTFLLNYVPNIGGLIAAVPPVLLALVQLGTGTALAAAGGILAVHLVLGNWLEPRYMGHGLGLSTLVVFLSLVFWGWVLGPVGMLLSVPLTTTLKIALEVNPRGQRLAVLLGPPQDCYGAASEPPPPAIERGAERAGTDA